VDPRMKKIIFLFLLLFPDLLLKPNITLAQEKTAEYLTVPINFSCWHKDKVYIQVISSDGILMEIRPLIVNCNDGTVKFKLDSKYDQWKIKIVVE
jgi:hypothetical protein